MSSTMLSRCCLTVHFSFYDTSTSITSRQFFEKTIKDKAKAERPSALNTWSPAGTSCIITMTRTGKRAVNKAPKAIKKKRNRVLASLRSVLRKRTPPDRLVQKRLEAIKNEHGLDTAKGFLANHLLIIIDIIEKCERRRANWTEAYEALYDQKFWSDLNKLRPLGNNYGCSVKRHEIDSKDFKTPKQQAKEIKSIMVSKCFYYNESGNMILPDFFITVKHNALEAKTAENTNWVAKVMVPIALEEWIHMFQHMTNGYVSANTAAFSKSILWNRVGNLNEVDVYATYRDLGWPKSLLDEFRKRYKERGRFEEYMKLKKKRR